MPPENMSRSAFAMTSRGDDFGINPSAPRSIALRMLSRSWEADRTTSEIVAWRLRRSVSTANPSRSGRLRSSSIKCKSGCASTRRIACRESAASNTVASGANSLRTPRNASRISAWSSTRRIFMRAYFRAVSLENTSDPDRMHPGRQKLGRRARRAYSIEVGKVVKFSGSPIDPRLHFGTRTAPHPQHRSTLSGLLRRTVGFRHGS
jgi:hypothetical protein